MTLLTRRTLALPVAAALSLALAVPALAQDEAQKTTISRIDAGETIGTVYLEGAALEQVENEAYLFSDGTGVIALDISIDTSAAEAEVPLFTLIGIEGSVAGDEIDVSRWEVLPIMTPAVIVEEEQVIEAFWGWIIAYGSQAPVE
ncbi:MAG: NirD/YgiW/YdeI family stress tolerance protein [Chloroflexota bacterium]|nr:NirD/YgiW/YdeI family stress tolerance protein [Chloroflexota bacterium]